MQTIGTRSVLEFLLYSAIISVCVIVLWLVLDVIAYADPLSVNHTQVWFLIAVILIVAASSIWLDKKNGHCELLSCKNFFLVFLLLQFAIWPAWVLVGDVSSMSGIPLTFLDTNYHEAVIGMTCAVTGLAFFYLGYYWWHAPRQTELLGAGSVDHRRITPVVAMCAIAGCAASLTLMHSYGGPKQFITHLDDFRTLDLGGTGVYFITVRFVYVAFLLSLCVSLRQRTYRKLTPVLLITTMLVGLASADRQLAMEAPLVALVLKHYVKSRYRVNIKLFFIGLLLVSLNIGYVAFRFGRGDVSLLLQGPQGLSFVIFNGFFERFHGVESAARIVSGTEKTGYDGGIPFIESVALFWMPKKLWPGKPPPFQVLASVNFYPEAFSDIDGHGSEISSLVGGLYWIGGPTAVCFGMGLMGLMLGWADRFIRYQRGILALGVYAHIMIFSFYVNEAPDLYVQKLLQGLSIWTVVCALAIRPQGKAQRQAIRGIDFGRRTTTTQRCLGTGRYGEPAS